jgi:uncharacterized membrane protein YqgA involved in biofilm formation
MRRIIKGIERKVYNAAPMTGTLLNIATILIGGALGLLFGARLPERMRQTVVAGLGLFTAAIGLSLFLDSQNVIIVLVSLLIGGVLGEWWQIEDGLARMGTWLQTRFSAKSEGGAARFVRGFLTASLVFCVGPLTVLGSIQDGLTGDYHLLAIKSTLDGVAAMVFASSLGVGVLFSVLVVLVYQGGLSLLAQQAQAIFSEAMIAEMSAVGGLLLIGLAISSLLEIKPIRVGNFLPAIVVAPLIVAILSALNISFVP